eukprot:CAMPEP_0174909048 /NCGR_PEP_ID=MMETSP0167-20121228/66874_1 /TAXON_ID=38298 /ORGANISM="Rhodella maculata, Strain CCMP736" /LENGTH=90 /DNA_ID=CAMNT_0016152927 /DNA_START=177 /DNA_END=449 /DNA_ORIENTATION=+
MNTNARSRGNSTSSSPDTLSSSPDTSSSEPESPDTSSSLVTSPSRMNFKRHFGHPEPPGPATGSTINEPCTELTARRSWKKTDMHAKQHA